MAEEQLPAWLAELKGQQPPQEEPRPEEGPREEIVGRLIEGMQDEEPAPAPAFQPDMVDDLREQIIQSEDDFEESPSVTGLLPGMQPWQGFVLALLLLMDVAVLGCLALLVTGRVMFPF